MSPVDYEKVRKDHKQSKAENLKNYHLDCLGIMEATGQVPEAQNGTEVSFICPFHPDGKPSFNINPIKNVWICHGCGKGGGSWKLAAEFAGVDPDDKEGVKKWLKKNNLQNGAGGTNPYVLKVLKESLFLEDPSAAPARKYLKKRGLKRPKDIPVSLMFHPNLKYTDEKSKSSYHPALIGLFMNETRTTGILRTYLNEKGEKANVSKAKKSLGSVSGSAIQLDFLEGNEEILNITEGIETGLSIRETTGYPTWAAGSAGNLKKIDIPSHVSEVHIFSDYDINETGQQAAEALARKLNSEGREVYVHIPDGWDPPEGEKNVDWLDVLNAEDGADEIWNEFEQGELWAPGDDGSVVCLADVTVEKVDFLWHPYISVGKVNMWDGNPGVGKSWVTIAIAAAVTGGASFPRLDIEPSNVLFLSAEDGIADTIKPRAKSLGADCKRIFAVTEPFVLDEEGFTRTEQYLEHYKPKLMIIDPLVAYLGGKVDMYRSNEVRSVMAKLNTLASRFKVAISCVRHLTKDAKAHAIYRGQGSIDFIAACRSALLVGSDPENPDKRVIVHTKSNVSRLGHSIGFQIKEDANRKVEFKWTGFSNLTADKILQPTTSSVSSMTDEATDFLSQALSDGPRPALALIAEAKELGITHRPLYSAKEALEIKSEKTGYEDGYWLWLLPDQSAEDYEWEEEDDDV